MSAAQPVIIIKKKGGHGHGHHGGAWKVAYADFVTAMMAFFLVMWIVGQDKPTKAAIAGYFRDPGAFQQTGRGVLPGAESGVAGGPAAAGASNLDLKDALQKAAEHLREVIEAHPSFAGLKDRIEIKVSDEGLRIELREAPNDGFFASGSAAMKPETVELLTVIATELKQLGHKVAVEGHTDSVPYASTDGYSNWELSSDRANAARRVMQQGGIPQQQVEEVRGFADTHPRYPEKPADAGNRRISIVVRPDNMTL
jgi:chemotaxis protein MotB